MVLVNTVFPDETYAYLRGVSPEQHGRDIDKTMLVTMFLVPRLNELFEGQKFIPQPQQGSISEIKILEREILLGHEKLTVKAIYNPATNEVFVKVQREDGSKPEIDFDNVKLYLVNQNGKQVGWDAQFESTNQLRARVTCPADATELRVRPSFVTNRGRAARLLQSVK